MRMVTVSTRRPVFDSVRFCDTWHWRSVPDDPLEQLTAHGLPAAALGPAGLASCAMGRRPRAVRMQERQCAWPGSSFVLLSY
jgi:hypothetical protein